MPDFRTSDFQKLFAALGRAAKPTHCGGVEGPAWSAPLSPIAAANSRNKARELT